MPLRPLVLLSLIALLAACSSDKPKPVAPVAAAVKPDVNAIQPRGPLPAYQRELTGTLLGADGGFRGGRDGRHRLGLVAAAGREQRDQAQQNQGA